MHPENRYSKRRLPCRTRLTQRFQALSRALAGLAALALVGGPLGLTVFAGHADFLAAFREHGALAMSAGALLAPFLGWILPGMLDSWLQRELAESAPPDKPHQPAEVRVLEAAPHRPPPNTWSGSRPSV